MSEKYLGDERCRLEIQHWTGESPLAACPVFVPGTMAAAREMYKKQTNLLSSDNGSAEKSFTLRDQLLMGVYSHTLSFYPVNFRGKMASSLPAFELPQGHYKVRLHKNGVTTTLQIGSPDGTSRIFEVRTAAIGPNRQNRRVLQLLCELSS